VNKPEDMFDIIMEDSEFTGLAGGTFNKRSYYLIYKPTGERHFPKTRKYGYSHLLQAKIARTKLFNTYMKSLEENLLGKS